MFLQPVLVIVKPNGMAMKIMQRQTGWLRRQKHGWVRVRCDSGIGDEYECMTVWDKWLSRRSARNNESCHKILFCSVVLYKILERTHSMFLILLCMSMRFVSQCWQGLFISYVRATLIPGDLVSTRVTFRKHLRLDFCSKL